MTSKKQYKCLMGLIGLLSACTPSDGEEAREIDDFDNFDDEIFQSLPTNDYRITIAVRCDNDDAVFQIQFFYIENPLPQNTPLSIVLSNSVDQVTFTATVHAPSPSAPTALSVSDKASAVAIISTLFASKSVEITIPDEISSMGFPTFVTAEISKSELEIQEMERVCTSN